MSTTASNWRGSGKFLGALFLRCCFDEELVGAERLSDQRSEDLGWQSLPPDSDPAKIKEMAGGPRAIYSVRDYTAALWNLETQVGTRSVEREVLEDCDVQTYTVRHPRTEAETVYARTGVTP